MMYGGCYVFKYDPKTKSIEAIVTDMDRPNGVALSRDETHLIISNTGDVKYLRRYEIDKNLNISKPIEFARQDPEHVFDGFRFDIDDNLWTSCGDGVACYAPSGEQIGYIKMPEFKYTGQFENGVPEGYGVEEQINGVRYFGSWSNGLKQGFGTVDFGNGATYVGEFKNGLAYEGKYDWGDGRVTDSYQDDSGNWLDR